MNEHLPYLHIVYASMKFHVKTAFVIHCRQSGYHDPRIVNDPGQRIAISWVALPFIKGKGFAHLT